MGDDQKKKKQSHMRALYLLIRGTEYPQQTACPYWISVKNKWWKEKGVTLHWCSSLSGLIDF